VARAAPPKPTLAQSKRNSPVFKSLCQSQFQYEFYKLLSTLCIQEPQFLKLPIPYTSHFSLHHSLTQTTNMRPTDFVFFLLIPATFLILLLLILFCTILKRRQGRNSPTDLEGDGTESFSTNDFPETWGTSVSEPRPVYLTRHVGQDAGHGVFWL
jgi:hypothetical protein